VCVWHRCWKSERMQQTHTQNILMGWLRLVGSLKWQVCFAEYHLFYRALSQKRPIILRSLLIVATPHISYVEYETRTLCVFVAKQPTNTHTHTHTSLHHPPDIRQGYHVSVCVCVAKMYTQTHTQTQTYTQKREWENATDAHTEYFQNIFRIFLEHF